MEAKIWEIPTALTEESCEVGELRVYIEIKEGKAEVCFHINGRKAGEASNLAASLETGGSISQRREIETVTSVETCWRHAEYNKEHLVTFAVTLQLLIQELSPLFYVIYVQVSNYEHPKGVISRD